MTPEQIDFIKKERAIAIEKFPEFGFDTYDRKELAKAKEGDFTYFVTFYFLIDEERAFWVSIPWGKEDSDTQCQLTYMGIFINPKISKRIMGTPEKEFKDFEELEKFLTED
jgi:hypothetical protein